MTTLTGAPASASDVSLPTFDAQTPGLRVQDLGDMLIWPLDAEATRYAFLPKEPMIATNADGSPKVSLIEAGDLAFLNLSAQWMVPDARLEEVRAALETQRDVAVQLSFAGVENVRAVLEIGESGRIEARSTSGMPPYAAMFSAQVTGDDKAVVQAALAGQAARVGLRYYAELTVSRQVDVRLSGQLEGEPTREALEEAIQDGRIQMTHAGTLSLDADSLMERALISLSTTDRPDDGDAFSLTVSEHVRVAHSVEVHTDFGAGLSPQIFFNAVLPSPASHD